MRILVACEESQMVCKAFRARGFDAYSCDVKPCSGGKPKWHIQGDVLDELSNNYDLLIGHPPCTYMSKAGARWMYRDGQLNLDRYALALEAKEFFLKLWHSEIPLIALENPTPLSIVELPRHSQVIQPFMFGHPYSKRTLLWLKGLPHLKATYRLTKYTPYLPSNTGGKTRHLSLIKDPAEASVTFPGIAQAMAKQWGDFLLAPSKSLFTELDLE